MVVTKAQLHEARKKLTDNGIPIVIIAEILLHLTYFGIKPEYDKTDLEVAFINEIASVWTTDKYSKDNILKIINTNVGDLDTVLGRIKDIKTNGTKALGIPLQDPNLYFQKDRGNRVIAIWEQQAIATETELKTWTDTFTKEKYPNGVLDINKQINDWSQKVEEYRGAITSRDDIIKAKNESINSLNKRPDIKPEDYQKLVDNQEKHTDYDTIKKERDNWVAVFPSPLTPNLVKAEYDKPKEVHTDYDTIKADLGKWIETFGAGKTPADLKTSLDQQITNLTNESKAKDTTINDLNHTIKDKDKIIDDNKGLDQKLIDLNKQLSDKDIELNKRTDTITSLTTERDGANQTIKDLKGQLASQETQGNTKLFFITRKLLSIYVEEIKKRTELFYQELSLDNNKVNSKYGDPNKPYLLLLHNLTADSKPEQIINAFRIVALIIATERSQSESDELIKLSRIPVALKNNKLKYFQKVKDGWDLLTTEPKEENNPLYLPVIKDQANYRKQIQEIITLWAK